MDIIQDNLISLCNLNLSNTVVSTFLKIETAAGHMINLLQQTEHLALWANNILHLINSI